MGNCPDTDIDPISLSAVHIYNFHIFTVIYKGLVIIHCLRSRWYTYSIFSNKEYKQSQEGTSERDNRKLQVLYHFHF